MCCFNFSSYEFKEFLCPNDVIVIFTLLSLLMMYKPCVCVEVLVCKKDSALKCLWVSFLVNPHEPSLNH
jgi:hypothetical protein